METVTIDGVEYVKASVLAKRLHYTADYIGQLCRGRKVDAHLVGRTWYVYPPSLEGHKSTRYADLRSGEIMKDNNNNLSISRIDVSAPLSKKTARSQKMHFQDRVFWKQSYESDESDLLPSVKKPESAQYKMPIKLADSERLRVAAVSHNVTMVSQAPPAVSLAGTLKVQSFETTYEVEDVNSVEKYSHIDVDGKVMTRSVTDDEEVQQPGSIPEEEQMSPVVTALAESEIIPSKQRTSIPALDQRPSKGKLVPSLRVPGVIQSNERSTSPFFRLVIMPLVVILLVVAASGLVLLESVVSVKAGEEEQSLFRLNYSIVSAIFAAF